jgi:hypothetical protein
MSAAPFAHQVEQLVYELNRCVSLCKDIRVSRRIGSTHENLDRLQSAFERAASKIASACEDLGRIRRRDMDIGDGIRRLPETLGPGLIGTTEVACTEMELHINQVQTTIKQRLVEIAYPTQPRQPHQRQSPNFRCLLNQWKLIYEGVSSTIFTLTQRFEAASVSRLAATEAEAQPTTSSNSSKRAGLSPVQELQPRAAPAPAPAPAHEGTDKVTMAFDKFQIIVKHMKNCWKEVVVDGEIEYVNCFDNSKT